MNLLTQLMASIRMGQQLKKNLIKVNHSQPCLAFLKVLWEEGLILGYDSRPHSGKIPVVLKYHHNTPVIKDLYSCAISGRQLYLKARNLEKWQGIPELLILSTARQGIVSHKEAFSKKIGGQLICRIKI